MTPAESVVCIRVRDDGVVRIKDNRLIKTSTKTILKNINPMVGLCRFLFIKTKIIYNLLKLNSRGFSNFCNLIIGNMMTDLTYR